MPKVRTHVPLNDDRDRVAQNKQQKQEEANETSVSTAPPQLKMDAAALPPNEGGDSGNTNPNGTFQFKSEQHGQPADGSTQPFQFKKGGSDSSFGTAQKKEDSASSVMQKMESSFQTDFSNVNIHENSQSASDAGALAYTQGNDVHFAPGQFKPDSKSGQELIGHELTHVVQQRKGQVEPTSKVNGFAVNDDKGLEKEADDMGKKAAEGKTAQTKVSSDSPSSFQPTQMKSADPDRQDDRDEDSRESFQGPQSGELADTGGLGEDPNAGGGADSPSDPGSGDGISTQAQSRPVGAQEETPEFGRRPGDNVPTNNAIPTQEDVAAHGDSPEMNPSLEDPSADTLADPAAPVDPEAESAALDEAAQQGAEQEGQEDGDKEAPKDEAKEGEEGEGKEGGEKKGEGGKEGAKGEGKGGGAAAGGGAGGGAGAPGAKGAAGGGGGAAGGGGAGGGNILPLDTSKASMGNFGAGKEEPLFIATPDFAASLSPEAKVGSVGGGGVIIKGAGFGSVAKDDGTGEGDAPIQMKPDGKKGGPEVMPVDKGETNKYYNDRRKKAKKEVDSFAKQATNSVEPLRRAGQDAVPKIQQKTASAQAAVRASVEQNKARIEADIQRQITRSEAAHRRNQQAIDKQYQHALERIEKTTSSTKEKIKGDHDAMVTKLDGLCETVIGKVQTAFSEAQTATREVGTTKGAEAVRIAGERAATYASEALPSQSRWENFKNGEDYPAKKRQAKVDAAKQVGDGYNEEFVKVANDTASQLSGGMGDVVQGVRDKIQEAKDQVKARYEAAIQQLEAASTGAKDAAKATKEQYAKASDDRLTSQLEALNQLKTSQVEQVSSTGDATIEQIGQVGDQAAAGIGDQVNNAITSIEKTINDTISKASNVENPDPAAIKAQLQQVLGQVRSAVQESTAQINEAVSSSSKAIADAETGAKKSIYDIFKNTQKSASEMRHQFTKDLDQIEKGNYDALRDIGKMIDDGARDNQSKTKADMDTLYGEAEKGFNTMEGTLKGKLDETTKGLEGDFQTKLDGIQSVITEKANEAADKVKPRWKAWACILIDIVIAIVVTALIIVVMASGLGLLATIGLAFVIGAAGGILKTALKDGVNGELSSFGTYLKEGVLGGIGGLITLAGAGLGNAAGSWVVNSIGGKIASEFGKKAIGFAVETVVGTAIDTLGAGITDTVTRLMTGQPVSWGTFTGAMKDSFVTNLAGNFFGGLVGGWAASKLFGKAGAEATEAVVREGGEEVIENATEATIKETTEETVENATEATVRETTENTVENATEGAVKETAEETAEETIETQIENSVKDSGNGADDAVNSTIKDSAEEITEETAEQTARKTGSQVAEEAGYPSAPEGYHWANYDGQPVLRRNPGKGPVAGDQALPQLRYDPNTGHFVDVGTGLVVKPGETINYQGGHSRESILESGRGDRPMPADYLPPEHIAAHLGKFDDGASYLVPKDVLDRFGRDALGREDGQFIIPKDQMDGLIARTGGDAKLIEAELGIPPGSWDGRELVRIDIDKPSDLNLRMASGNEGGANDLWIPGGHTPEGFPEAVVDQIPSGSFRETPVVPKADPGGSGTGTGGGSVDPSAKVDTGTGGDVDGGGGMRGDVYETGTKGNRIKDQKYPKSTDDVVAHVQGKLPEGVSVSRVADTTSMMKMNVDGVEVEVKMVYSGPDAYKANTGGGVHGDLTGPAVNRVTFENGQWKAEIEVNKNYAIDDLNKMAVHEMNEIAETIKIENPKVEAGSYKDNPDALNDAIKGHQEAVVFRPDADPGNIKVENLSVHDRAAMKELETLMAELDAGRDVGKQVQNLLESFGIKHMDDPRFGILKDEMGLNFGKDTQDFLDLNFGKNADQREVIDILHHVKAGEGRSGGVIKGGHDDSVFKKHITDGDVSIQSSGPSTHGTKGVTEYTYFTKKADGTGFVGDPNPTLNSKTTYDPSVWSDQKLIQASSEAWANAKGNVANFDASTRVWHGTMNDGTPISGHFDGPPSNPTMTTFWFGS